MPSLSGAGENFIGQLGIGNTTSVSIPAAVGGGLTFAAMICGGASHTCALGPPRPPPPSPR